MVVAFKVFVGLLLLTVLLVVAHFAVIEIGREVVTLRTPLPGPATIAEGGWKETRLWCVDHDGAVWLHSGGTDWLPQFAGNPVVELQRNGEIRRYRATPMPGAHDHLHVLLRAKYGLADRWVRFLGPDNETTLAVRLDPLPSP